MNRVFHWTCTRSTKLTQPPLLTYENPRSTFPPSHQLIGAENVKAVVSMNEDYELFYAVADRCFWTERDVRYLQLSTPDIFNAPSLEQLIRGVHFMQETADRGGSVYVHCKAGRTRSATLVACYLIQVRPPSFGCFWIRSRRSLLLKFSYGFFPPTEIQDDADRRGADDGGAPAARLPPADAARRHRQLL